MKYFEYLRFRPYFASNNKRKACSGIKTINTPESDFSGDSCTTLDPLHNFGDVEATRGGPVMQ